MGGGEKPMLCPIHGFRCLSMFIYSNVLFGSGIGLKTSEPKNMG
jgi:hypothetical protein